MGIHQEKSRRSRGASFSEGLHEEWKPQCPGFDEKGENQLSSFQFGKTRKTMSEGGESLEEDTDVTRAGDEK